MDLDKRFALLRLYNKIGNYKLFLFFYHLCFCFLAYHLRVVRGISDSHFYWAQYTNLTNHSWFDYADYGANFILFLNYPFLRFGFPFWFGFFLYGIVGYLGILQWMQFTERIIGGIYFKGYNFLPFIFFLPNLHYWTATLGKEPIVFLSLAILFNFVVDFKGKKAPIVLSFLFLLLIRPHVALLFLISLILILLFQKSYSLKRKIIFSIVSLSLFSVLLPMVFRLVTVKYWDWNRILYSNHYSVLSFRNSGSYVPMLEYPIWYKFFSFNFRPLFFDSNSIWAFFASLENCIILLLHLITLVVILMYYKNIIFPEWMKVVLLFSLVFSLVYIQRYANLGIFMRTKIMFQPFLIVGFISIIQQCLKSRKLMIIHE